MKVLFIGGTGNISSAVSRLAINRGIDLYHLNRGFHKVTISGVKSLIGDISNSATLPTELFQHHWDVVVNWIAFTEKDINRDIHLFQGKTRQYIFISSASVYQRPLLHPIVSESTPLCNPFWEYARQKIQCEESLNQAYRETDFPVTIVRPSHTYQTRIPVAIGGSSEYTIVDRILKGQKIIVHGDGTSLWTLTHSDDFAKGFIGLLGNTQAIGHAFQITADEILTWNQIYTTLADAVGKPANIIHIPSDYICRVDGSFTGTLLGDKATSVIFDNTKIKRFVPDFKATIPFSEGIRRVLAWFEASPERKTVNANTNDVIDKIIQSYES